MPTDVMPTKEQIELVRAYLIRRDSDAPIDEESIAIANAICNMAESYRAAVEATKATEPTWLNGEIRGIERMSDDDNWTLSMKAVRYLLACRASLATGGVPIPEDVRHFIYYITLELQQHRSRTEAQKDELFQRAYRLYVQYDVEGRQKKNLRLTASPTTGVVVPRVPTTAMIEAGRKAMEQQDPVRVSHARVMWIWNDMLGAAHHA